MVVEGRCGDELQPRDIRGGRSFWLGEVREGNSLWQLMDKQEGQRKDERFILLNLLRHYGTDLSVALN